MTDALLVQERSFALAVTEPDPARLQEIAVALRRTVINGGNHFQRVAAVRALLSRPETYALDSWKAPADVPHLAAPETLMNELARVMSPAAADILAQLWNPTPGPLLITTLPSVLLDNMYRAGDARLKQHIEGIFARHGKAISEHPLSFPG
ncbi:MAG: hypothetical protein JO250_18755 [Armatimonadetes bacterium]|nr:hypothetical protein [Armatimonadota bacterium]